MFRRAPPAEYPASTLDLRHPWQRAEEYFGVAWLELAGLKRVNVTQDHAAGPWLQHYVDVDPVALSTAAPRQLRQHLLVTLIDEKVEVVTFRLKQSGYSAQIRLGAPE